MSLKASELRIGNLISRKDLGNNEDRIETIIELGKKATTTGPIPVTVICAYDQLSPIPLTEEIAKKFNFEADHTRKRVYKSPETGIEIFFDSISEVSVYLGDYYIKTIKYAHDLQNIVFALSGEELKYEG